jgi:hypothetical protein
MLHRTRRARRTLGIGVSVAILSLAPTPSVAAADEASAEDHVRRVYDAVVLRPFGVVQVIVSAVFFVPAFPIAALFGAGDDALRICIEEPIAHTFRRPLGE